MNGLKDLALQLPTDSEAYTLAQELTDDTGAYRVGELFKAMCEEFGVSEKVGAAAVVGNAVRLTAERADMESAPTDNAGVAEVAEADIADFNAKTGMPATAEEFAEADRAVAQDQEAVRQVHAEREAGGVKYTPPTAKDIKAYSTEDTEVYSRVLSRTVYMYDGASHAQAEAGFAENGVVYINKNAPVNRNSVAVVLAHEYTHTIEGTKAYKKLVDTVFKSKGYAKMLATAGTNGEISLTHDEYLQQIINDYDKARVPLGKTAEQKRAGAEKEAIAKYLSEYVFQSEDALIELARTDRGWFEDVYAQIRRFIARLHEKMPDKRELMKLECLFAKAAKAANRVSTGETAVQNNVAQYGLKGHHGKGIAKRRKSWYSQFESEAMSWANRGDRRAGDMCMLPDGRRGSARNTFCLLEADGVGGYIELKVGKYEAVKDLYDYFESKKIDGPSYSISNDSRSMRRNSSPSGNGRMYGGYDSSIGTDAGTRFDTTTDNEHLWSGDQGTSVNGTQYSLPSQSALQTPSYLELTPEQRLERDTKEASRLLERKHAVDNAPPEVAPVLERIMDELDILRETSTPVTTAQPTAFTQSVEGGGVLDAPKQSADTSAQTNILAPTNQSAVGALHEAPATKSTSITSAETVSTTLDTEQPSSTPLGVDENSETEYTELTYKKQYEQYASVLQELAPQSFEEFRKLRDTDPERFKELEDQYQTLSMYKIDSGSMTAKEILELDNRTITEKNNSFIGDYRKMGNIASAYIDGDLDNLFFAHSQINSIADASEYYKGLGSLVILKEHRRFNCVDVYRANGSLRGNTFYDTEAKLFEYFADLYEQKPFTSITMLSERGMCDSCKGVMEQFKKQFLDVTINVVSNKRVEGNVWKNRRKKK